jgi:hypothetical protein
MLPWKAKPKRREPLKRRREERELLFWTLQEALAVLWLTLRLILFAALVAYVILSLIEGRPIGVESAIRALQTGSLPMRLLAEQLW